MTNLYGKNHRELQDNFDSRKIADRLEDLIVKKELDDSACEFIESLDMFYLKKIKGKLIRRTSLEF